MQDVKINTETIPLCQMLKIAGVIDSGGQARFLLEDGIVLRNGVQETAKRRQLRDGDIIEVRGKGVWRIVRQGA